MQQDKTQLSKQTSSLSEMMKELAEIKRLIAVIINSSSNGLPLIEKEFLTVDEAAALLCARRSYIYRLTHEKRIPYSKPGGNRVLIKRTDLLEWMQSNSILSDSQIRDAATKRASPSRRRS